MSSVAIVHARASSPRETRMNAKLAAAITPRPIPSRAKRNGMFSHAAFCGIGCVTHGKIRLRPKYNPKNRKNPTHRNGANASPSRYGVEPPHFACVR